MRLFDSISRQPMNQFDVSVLFCFLVVGVVDSDSSVEVIRELKRCKGRLVCSSGWKRLQLSVARAEVVVASGCVQMLQLSGV